MAVAGPIPKRSDQRRRVNKIEGFQQAPGAPIVRVPAASRTWHPLAKAWYASLKASGQSRYYEPSDWQTARILADQIDRMLKLDEPNATLLNVIMQASRDLMTTEGQRRRMRLELTREPADMTIDVAASDVDNIITLALAGA